MREPWTLTGISYNFLNSEITQVIQIHLQSNGHFVIQTQSNGCWWLRDSRNLGINIHSFRQLILGFSPFAMTYHLGIPYESYELYVWYGGFRMYLSFHSVKHDGIYKSRLPRRSFVIFIINTMVTRAHTIHVSTSAKTFSLGQFV